MPRITLLVLKAVNISLYAFILYMFLFSFDPIFKFQNIMTIETNVLDEMINTFTGLLDSLKNVIVYVVYGARQEIAVSDTPAIKTHIPIG